MQIHRIGIGKAAAGLTLIHPGLLRLTALAALLLVGIQPASASFHTGGVGSCQRCHILHASEDGWSDSPSGYPMLLRYNSATDLCLSCHAEALGEVLGPNPLDPPPERGGGNFTFLLEDNLNDAPDGAQNPIGGHRAGHSVVSPAWGLPEDPDHPQSPGGSFPGGALSCTSCHDPHGNQNFRMLRGQGEVTGTNFFFTFPAPLGEGLDIETGVESQTSHTAYLGGWTDWCANCHGYYHDEGQHQGFEHPADHDLEGEHRNTYNEYLGPDDPESGNPATAYVPAVPIEDPSQSSGSTYGATSQSRVSCLTCHRAHASSAPAATRWDPNVLFLQNDGQSSGSFPLPDPFNHPQQRALCVKCHYSEAESHGFGSPCLQCHRQLED